MGDCRPAARNGLDRPRSRSLGRAQGRRVVTRLDILGSPNTVGHSPKATSTQRTMQGDSLRSIVVPPDTAPVTALNLRRKEGGIAAGLAGDEMQTSFSVYGKYRLEVQSGYRRCRWPSVMARPPRP